MIIGIFTLKETDILRGVGTADYSFKVLQRSSRILLRSRGQIPQGGL
jgi:hypothetical protein